MKQIALFALLTLTGCGLIQPSVPNSGPPFQVSKPGGLQGLGGQGVSVASLDQPVAPVPVSAGARALGAVTVGLGSPTEGGLWLSSDLVTAPMMGSARVAGKSVGLELRPSTSGALMSFAAYRALGLTLTDLPSVQVFAN